MAGGIKVKRACEIVGLSSSTLYTPQRIKKQQNAKAESDLQLIAQLRSTARAGQGYRLRLERLQAAWESEHVGKVSMVVSITNGSGGCGSKRGLA